MKVCVRQEQTALRVVNFAVLARRIVSEVIRIQHLEYLLIQHEHPLG